MNTDAPTKVFDVAIVGAGPAGLSFAAALRGSGLSVMLIEKLSEANLADPPYDGREIALTLRSVRLMKALGQWDRIPAEERSPLRGARVQNGAMHDALELHPRRGETGEFGWMVSNHRIRRAAYETVRESVDATLLTGVGVTSIAVSPADARLTLSDGRELRCRLVVAADSRFSETRRALGIPADHRDFGKSMLVCRMEHEREHDGVACEWFDHRQTLALLPLAGRCSSVVLTLRHADIERLRSLTPEDFEREMQRRLGPKLVSKLGAMRLASERFAYPLVAVYPERFVTTRYAVIGDAAVGMHPVTAHGFNFGLAGQDRLAQLVRAAATAGRDIGADALLADYERQHRRATRPLYVATNAIVRLFTDDSPPARFVRATLLKVASRVTPVSLVLSGLLMERGPLEALAKLPLPRPPRLSRLIAP